VLQKETIPQLCSSLSSANIDHLLLRIIGITQTLKLHSDKITYAQGRPVRVKHDA